MQVQRVQNNNYNTNFCAKPQIKGMEQFPSQAVKGLEKCIKSIGKENDVIAIHLNGIEPTVRQLERFRMGHKGGKEQYWQNIDIASVIDGEVTPKRISVLVITKNVATRKRNVERIMAAISSYLNLLKKGKHKNVAGTQLINHDKQILWVRY